MISDDGRLASFQNDQFTAYVENLIQERAKLLKEHYSQEIAVQDEALRMRDEETRSKHLAWSRWEEEAQAHQKALQGELESLKSRIAETESLHRY
jgi:hypothetical protein